MSEGARALGSLRARAKETEIKKGSERESNGVRERDRLQAGERKSQRVRDPKSKRASKRESKRACEQESERASEQECVGSFDFGTPSFRFSGLIFVLVTLRIETILSLGVFNCFTLAFILCQFTGPSDSIFSPWWSNFRPCNLKTHPFYLPVTISLSLPFVSVHLTFRLIFSPWWSNFRPYNLKTQPFHYLLTIFSLHFIFVFVHLTFRLHLFPLVI